MEKLPNWAVNELNRILYGSDMESDDVVVDGIISCTDEEICVHYHWGFCSGEGTIHLHRRHDAVS